MGATGNDTTLHACRGHGPLLQAQKRIPDGIRPTPH
jgi:hypothetical protein